MSVSLDLNTYVRPLHRVLSRVWSASIDATTGLQTGPPGWTPWTPMVMSQRLGATTATNGLVVGPYSRYCLPMIGEATLYYRYGRINGINYSPIDSLLQAIPPDLKRAEVKIQAAPSLPFTAGREAVRNFAPVWRTVWHGTVEHIEVDPQRGQTTFHCFDGFFRAKRWQMTRHHVYYYNVYQSRSHPGYNVSVDGYYARVLGNKNSNNRVDDPTGDIAQAAAAGMISGNRNYAHTFSDGTAARWTDQEVVESICMGARGRGEPVLEMRGQTQLFSAGYSSWPVVDGEDAWGLVAKICDRRRGRGNVFYDWEDDTANPFAEIRPFLQVRAQVPDDLVYTPPGGTLTTLLGAVTSGTAKAVDVAGDQRLVPGSLIFGDRQQYRFDYIESQGEYIEALVTLSGIDQSLGKRWNQTDETAFALVTNPSWRSTARWDPVWQRYGIPQDWLFVVKDGNNGAKFISRCDYFCDDTGTIIIPETGNNIKHPYASPLMTSILPDLPLYEGYDYTNNPPVRYDGSTDITAPIRRPCMAFQRSGSDLYLDLSRIGFSLNVDPSYGVLIRFGNDQQELVAGRYFSGPGVPQNAALWTDLILTVGLRLPNRVRLASGDSTSQRKLTIIHPNIHLWLANPGAIWELNRAASTVAAGPALRQAAGSGNTAANYTGILRDDRQSLAHLHKLTEVWYMRDHRTVDFALRTCGFLPSWTDSTGAVVNFINLGELVTTVAYTDRLGAAQTVTCNVPCTGKTYDPDSDTTTWKGDWNDLDFVSR